MELNSIELRFIDYFYCTQYYKIQSASSPYNTLPKMLKFFIRGLSVRGPWRCVDTWRYVDTSLIHAPPCPCWWRWEHNPIIIPWSAEIDDELLGPPSVEGHLVHWTPYLTSHHCLEISQFTVVIYEFYEGIGDECRYTTSEEGLEGRAQYTTLCCACVQGCCGGEMGAQTDHLMALRHEAEDPIT